MALHTPTTTNTPATSAKAPQAVDQEKRPRGMDMVNTLSKRAARESPKKSAFRALTSASALINQISSIEVLRASRSLPSIEKRSRVRT
jgi:hypothetical protein